MFQTMKINEKFEKYWCIESYVLFSYTNEKKKWLKKSIERSVA